MRRSWIGLVCSVAVVLHGFGVLAFGAADGERVAEGVGAALERAGYGGGALVVHYHRPDGEYGGWNLWSWPEGGDGAAYGFGAAVAEWLGEGGVQMGGETAFGRYAVVPVDVGVERVGFVVRRGEWEAKDVDRDRFVSFGEGGAEAGEVREVWLASGNEAVFEAPGDVDLSLRVLGAFLDGGDRVTLALSGALDRAVRDRVQVLRDGDGGSYWVRGIERSSRGVSRGVVYELELDREVSFGDVSNLSVRVEGVEGESIVYARGVLDEARFYDTEAELGANWGESSTVFRVWSPVSERVEVLVYGGWEDGGLERAEPARVVPMTHAGRGVWEAEVAGDLHGVVYRVAYHSYGERRVAADIHCRAASLDSGRSVVVDMGRTDPVRWGDLTPPVLSSVTDEVIYEIHVRDYSVWDGSLAERFRGTYLGLVHDGVIDAGGERVRTGVGHLEELGVTAVHLLPIQDFGGEPGAYNWGYWTSLFNVAESDYATDPGDPLAAPRELKLAIAGLHARGVRVILDVVYNHTSSSYEWSPFFQSVPYYWFRTTVDGRLRNDAGVGNSMADERAMVGDYIGDSLEYWLREYKVDGFRFDLLGTHRPESVRGWVERMRSVRPDATLYGEPWTGGGPTYFGKGEQQGMGIAVFNDDVRNAIRGDLDGTATGFATGEGGDVRTVWRGVAGMVGAWARESSEVVNYVSAHDNLTLWDKIELAQPGADEATKRSMVKLAHGMVLTMPGIAFIHGGADMARTKFGDHNSYNAGDEINAFRWERKAEYRGVFEYVAGLIELRKRFDVLRDDGVRDGAVRFVETGDDDVVAWEVGRVLPRSGYRMMVVYNGGADASEVALPGGGWAVLVDDERAGGDPLYAVEGSVELPGNSMMVLMRPGA